MMDSPDIQDARFWNRNGEELTVQLDSNELVFMTLYDIEGRPTKKYIYASDDPRTLSILEPFIGDSFEPGHPL